MNGKRTERALRAIDPDELAGAVGGKAITAEELRVAACPARHANAAPTGQKRKASFALFRHCGSGSTAARTAASSVGETRTERE